MSPIHRKLLLTGFVVSPFVVLILLVYWIAASLNNPNINKLPPIGAGAGQTGGANAIGEGIKKLRDATPVAVPVSLTEPAGPANSSEAAEEDMVNPVDLETGFMIVVNDKTGKSSASSPIYLAGSINGWNPGDPRFKFGAQSDMKWRLHVTKQMLATKPSTLEFKFTRGSWDLEELNADFTVPANKLLGKIKKSEVKEGVPPQIEYSIVAWSDTDPNHKERHLGEDYRPIKSTGTLRRLQVRGGAGTAEHRARDLQVWLPPGYDAPENAGETYPVLYMHDGQNLFEKHQNVPDEWAADETAKRLIEAGQIRPIIIVGVPHSGGGRINEYMPIAGARDGVEAQGQVHVRWLVSEVMPRVQRAFRVSSNPAETVIGGSSLGAIISIEAYSVNPQLFGGLLLESPSLTLGNREVVNNWLATKTQWPAKVFIGVGGKELGGDAGERNVQYVAAAKELEQRIGRSSAASTTRLSMDPEATHNEAAWAKRLPEALQFFFGK
jgi:predicted alpha/beta superfamily hydrolase